VGHVARRAENGASVDGGCSKDPIETLMDILVEDERFTSNAVFGMSEPDVALALQQPWTSADNDSQGTAPDGMLGKEHPHPRAYGTFSRILRKYVREEHKLTIEDAIRKFTALPAQRMGLTDRGVLNSPNRRTPRRPPARRDEDTDPHQVHRHDHE
jgi:N-acyl-D-aspartate/D-glutamate deacylase